MSKEEVRRLAKEYEDIDTLDFDSQTEKNQELHGLEHELEIVLKGLKTK